MNTAKNSNRNEFSSIHARIEDIIGSAWGQSPATTRQSRKTRSLSGTHASKPNGTRTPRAWNESFAFAIDAVRLGPDQCAASGVQGENEGVPAIDVEDPRPRKLRRGGEVNSRLACHSVLRDRKQGSCVIIGVRSQTQNFRVADEFSFDIHLCAKPSSRGMKEKDRPSQFLQLRNPVVLAMEVNDFVTNDGNPLFGCRPIRDVSWKKDYRPHPTATAEHRDGNLSRQENRQLPGSFRLKMNGCRLDDLCELSMLLQPTGSGDSDPCTPN